MRYIKSYSQVNSITEAYELDPMEVLHLIKNKPGGCSLQDLLKIHPDSAQIMTALDTLTNQSAIELYGAKYRAI